MAWGAIVCADSRFTTHGSRLTALCTAETRRFDVLGQFLPTHDCRLTTADSRFTIHDSRLTIHRWRLTAL